MDFVIEDQIPILGLSTTPYERDWDAFNSWGLYFRQNWNMAILVSILYFMVIPVVARD
jgi:hypothetical protein